MLCQRYQNRYRQKSLQRFCQELVPLCGLAGKEKYGCGLDTPALQCYEQMIRELVELANQSVTTRNFRQRWHAQLFYVRRCNSTTWRNQFCSSFLQEMLLCNCISSYSPSLFCQQFTTSNPHFLKKCFSATAYPHFCSQLLKCELKKVAEPR